MQSGWNPDTYENEKDMILNPWDVQSKHIHSIDGVASPLYAGECRYGGGEIYVLAAIEGNGIRPSHRGSGINDGKKMFTLNSTEVHGVVCKVSESSRKETEKHG